MKKRLISMLLTVFMVASLFSGMSLSAYATNSGEVFEYTMTEGDTVLAVCNAYGLNYYTCKGAIMQLNGFTSDQNFRFIPIGKVIKLPVSNAVAVSIAANGTTTTTTSQTGSTTTTTTTTANANGETIAYWLIPYTLQRGETIYSVCNALGIPYATYASQIQKINNIKSLSWVKAGQTVLFPSVKTPAVGVSCYEVRAHKVTAGETAYSICNADGVSYNGNIQLLQGLNNKDNLNYIATGSTFYVPVSTVISASTGTSGSPAGGSTTATATPATATTAPVSKVLYSLKSNSSTGGVVTFYVNGKVVTEAAAGDVVTVVPVADKGKALKSLGVVFSDGSAVPVLSGGDTFVMPTCAVTANAEFKGGSLITIDSSYSTHVKLMIDGVAGNSASAGSLVQVVSGDPSLSVDGKVVVTKSTGGNVNVSSDNSFKMPSCDVTVKVELKSVKTYDFYKVCEAAEGSFVLQSNGVTISKAAKGTEVTVLASPSIGYSVASAKITLRDDDGTLGTEYAVKNNKFTMPGQDVQVTVTFEADTSAIELAGTVNGSVVVKDSSDKKATVGQTGETYTIVLTPDTGYTAKKPTVKSLYDQTMVPVTGSDGDTTFTFVMPGKGALVIASFVGATETIKTEVRRVGTTVAATDTNCTVRINNLVDNGSGITTIHADELINVSTSLPDGIVLSRYEVKVGDTVNQELTDGANTNSSFLMPTTTDDVTVIAYVEAQDVAVKPVDLTGYSVKFVDTNDIAKQVSSYKVGDTATIVVTAKAGYLPVELANVLVTGAVSGSPIAISQATDSTGDIPGTFTFKIPAEGVKVSVSMTKQNYSIKLASTLGVADNDLVVVINGVSTLLTGTDGLIKASQGDSIFIDLSEARKAQGWKLSKIITTTASTGRIDYSLGNTWSFPMPAEDVTVDAVIKIPAAAIKADLVNCSIETYLTSDLATKVTTVYVGDEVQVKVIPKSKYYLWDETDPTKCFAAITGVTLPAGQPVDVYSDGTVTTFTFTMPAGQVLLAANAVRRNYDLQTAAAEGMQVNVTAEGATTLLGTGVLRTVHPGQTVKLALTADAAKTNTLTVVELSDSSIKVTNTSGVFSFVMPEADVAITTLTVTPKP